MSDTYVPISDFNTAMHALRGEIREDLSAIREEIGALRGLLQTNFDYRVAQAKEMSLAEGRLRSLEEKIGVIQKWFGGVSVTLGALLAWRLLEFMFKR